MIHDVGAGQRVAHGYGRGDDLPFLVKVNQVRSVTAGA
jgi:hypothetical protein